MPPRPTQPVHFHRQLTGDDELDGRVYPDACPALRQRSEYCADDAPWVTDRELRRSNTCTSSAHSRRGRKAQPLNRGGVNQEKSLNAVAQQVVSAGV